MKRALATLLLAAGVAVPFAGAASAGAATPPLVAGPGTALLGVLKPFQVHTALTLAVPKPVIAPVKGTAPTTTTQPTSSAPTTTTTAQPTPAPVVTTPTLPAPAPTLSVSLDPSFVQNGLQVMWSYSASASVQGVAQPSLPSGVLLFFSDGSLACSTDVGGSTTGGSCAVTYTTYGAHTTDVVYDSGTNSATTGTETYTIPAPPPPPPPVPLATTTTAGVTNGPICTGVDGGGLGYDVGITARTVDANGTVLASYADPAADSVTAVTFAPAEAVDAWGAAGGNWGPLPLYVLVPVNVVTTLTVTVSYPGSATEMPSHATLTVTIPGTC